MKTTLPHLIALMIISLTAWTAGGLPSRAADPLCEDALFQKMAQRGRLNGQMDVTDMENYVYKADSVLEYTCFNRFMTVSANNMTYYLNTSFINNAIKPTVTTWINNNYNHTSMGGRASPELTFAADAAPDYACDVMKVVWDAAKCLNPESNPPYDNMISVYEFLTTSDVRALPTACTAPANMAVFGIAPVSGAVIAVSSIPAPLPNCGAKIPTGTVVDLTSTSDTAFTGQFPVLSSSGRKYNEYVCANPACTYVPTDVNTGNCVAP